jgi:hypothetical protein
MRSSTATESTIGCLRELSAVDTIVRRVHLLPGSLVVSLRHHALGVVSRSCRSAATRRAISLSFVSLVAGLRILVERHEVLHAQQLEITGHRWHRHAESCR